MEPLLGQIIMFAGTFAPRGWALCDGQMLAISQHPQLFSLLGTTYGGDGLTSFALPDLRGRVAIHAGKGPGLSPRQPGDSLGVEDVRLTEAELPSHRHDLLAANQAATASRPGQAMLAHGAVYASAQADPQPVTALAEAAISPAGSGLAHENMQPTLCVNFIIATTGIYPARA